MQQWIIFIGLVTLAVLYIKDRKDIGKELLIAGVISLLWVMFSGIYNYTNNNVVFLGISLFPFILWTLWLVVLREIYEELKKPRFLKIVIISIIGIILFEYIGYNFLGINLTSNYPGLFGLNLLHAPFFAKIFYLTIGPIFILITDWLKVK